MLFENNNYKDYNLDLSFLGISMDDLISESNNQNLYDDKEGFLKGNMFKNEYKPYKNYQIGIIMPKNRKEEIELKLYQLDFAINDLNLYLDIHPDDSRMFNLFKEYVKEYKKVKEMYEKIDGPLCLTDATQDKYDWIYNWPWGGSKNV